MIRTLTAVAAAAALAMPASATAAEPVEVYCREVRVRLQYVVSFCLSYDTSGGTPAVIWECELRGSIPCDTSPIDPGGAGDLG